MVSSSSQPTPGLGAVPWGMALNALLLLGLALTVTGWVGVRSVAQQPWLTVLDNLHWTAGYASAALLALRAWTRQLGDARTIAGWTAVGLAMLTLGQLVWDVQVAVGWLPFPGPSDVFFLACGVGVSIGLWQVSRARLDPSALRALWLDVLSLLAGVLCLTMVLYLPRQGTYTGLQLLTMLLYPATLALPMALALNLLLALRCPLAPSTLALPIALALFATCWTTWNLQFLLGTLQEGAWLNIGFSVVAIGLGSAVHFLRLDASRDPRWDRQCENILRLMPIAMVALAATGVVLMKTTGQFSKEVQTLSLTGGMLVVALAMVRQSYMLRDRDRMLAAEHLVSQREKELEDLNRQLEERVAQRTEELVKSQKLAALGTLVAGVAHEMNTPIGNVRLVATALHDHVRQMQLQVDSDQVRRSALVEFMHQAAEATAMMDQGLERAAVLVSSFKQVAVDRTAELRRTFNLDQLVDDIVQIHRAVAHTRHNALQIAVPPGLQMDSFPGPLGQVVEILLENAYKHALNDKPDGRVSLSAHSAPDGTVVLRVADNGHGIAPEHLPKVFEPFFTTKLGQGGSGLGLHLAWNIVHDVLGGTITVRSEPGVGTTFELRLPPLA